MGAGTISALLNCQRGGVAMTFALIAVPLLTVVTGVIEVEDISKVHARLQAAVDAGALAGAERLTVASTTAGSEIAASAISTASLELGGNTGADSATFTVTNDLVKGTVTVVGTMPHKALIGFMGFGDLTITASATADGLQKSPLCILQTGPGGGMTLNDQSRIRATGCSVHANDDIKVATSAMIQADSVQAGGTVEGATVPAGEAGAAVISDPFGNLNLAPPSNCVSSTTQVIAGQDIVSLSPGVHCDAIKVSGRATLHLLPGEHYFMQPLEIKQNASLTGDDVALVFGVGKSFSFGDSGTVRITARRTGPLAGFLIATTRDNTQMFSIASGNVSELLGTIYIPSAELNITTSGNVAQDSAWSVIVAKTLTLNQNPDLIINNSYVGSGVPVPPGVGPSKVEPSLIQ